MTDKNDKISEAIYIGQHLIKSASFVVGSNELSFVDGYGNAIIIHEGGTEKDCHFCLKKKNMSADNFQYHFGTHHKYVDGVWEAYQGKNGLKIDSLSDEYMELWKKLSSRNF